MRRMTSSSDWDSRFFFLAADVLLLLLDAIWADTPLLLLLTVFPLLLTDTSPLEWATPVEDDSPFCAPFRQDSSESRSCPVPLACMVPRFMQVARCIYIYKLLTGATGYCGDNKTNARAADRPTDPDAAPNCPVPAADSPRLFRGGGRGDNPIFDSDDEQMEFRVLSTAAFCEMWCSLALSGTVNAVLKLLGRACYCCSQTAAALLWAYAVTSAEIPSRLFARAASPTGGAASCVLRCALSFKVKLKGHLLKSCWLTALHYAFHFFFFYCLFTKTYSSTWGTVLFLLLQ